MLLNAVFSTTEKDLTSASIAAAVSLDRLPEISRILLPEGCGEEVVASWQPFNLFAEVPPRVSSTCSLEMHLRRFEVEMLPTSRNVLSGSR